VRIEVEIDTLPKWCSVGVCLEVSWLCRQDTIFTPSVLDNSRNTYLIPTSSTLPNLNSQLSLPQPSEFPNTYNTYSHVNEPLSYPMPKIQLKTTWKKLHLFPIYSQLTITHSFTLFISLFLFLPPYLSLFYFWFIHSSMFITE
jgi:hypothetical protein